MLLFIIQTKNSFYLVPVGILTVAMRMVYLPPALWAQYNGSECSYVICCKLSRVMEHIEANVKGLYSYLHPHSSGLQIMWLCWEDFLVS